MVAINANKEHLVQIIKQVLEPCGFIRRKATWYRHYPDIVQVCHLEKSRWGEQFGINMSISISCLLPDKYPRENFCHIRAGLEWIITGNASGSKTLDFDDEHLSALERDALIREWVEKGTAWLDTMSSATKIAACLQANEKLLNRTTVDARVHFGLEPAPKSDK